MDKADISDKVEYMIAAISEFGSTTDYRMLKHTAISNGFRGWICSTNSTMSCIR